MLNDLGVPVVPIDPEAVSKLERDLLPVWAQHMQELRAEAMASPKESAAE